MLRQQPSERPPAWAPTSPSRPTGCSATRSAKTAPARLPQVQIVSYRSERGVRAGVLHDGQVVDAWDLLETGSAHHGVRELLERRLLDRLGAEVRGGGTP